jgi:hypothetical protein
MFVLCRNRTRDVLRNRRVTIAPIGRHIRISLFDYSLNMHRFQVVYLTHAPNCYFVWARQTGQAPRLLSACATGDDSSQRPLDKSQLSCATQTVARLYSGDVVNIAQREHNRTLWLRPGYSYFGFVKLSS